MAADRLVIDASASIAVLLDEDRSAAVDRAILERTSRGVRIFVPEMFWLEIANTLVRSYRQSLDTCLESMATLDRLGVTTVQSDRAGVLATMATMVEHSLTAYDATYLALAEALDAELLTLDRELATAAGERAVHLGRRTVRGSASSYRLKPWIRWAEAAEYLEAVQQGVV